MRVYLTLLLIISAPLAKGEMVLTNAVEILQAMLTSEPNDQPFDLTATATTPLNPFCKALSVKDDSGYINIIANNCERPPVECGDRFRIRGKVVRYPNGNRYASATTIEFLAHGQPPPPVDATPAEIYRGEHIYETVRVEGVVVDAFRDEADPRFTFLTLACGRDMLYLPSGCLTDRQIEQLVHATVSIIGECSTYRNSGPRAKLGYEVYIHRPEDITILKPAPSDPFLAPAFNFSGSVYEICRPHPDDPFARRKLTGRVLAVWQQTKVLIASGSNETSRIDLMQPLPPACGEMIEAVGLPETDFYHLNLSRAIWRRLELAPTEAPPALATTHRELLTDDAGRRRFNVQYHGRRVKLVGTVRGPTATEDECGFFLENLGDRIMVVLDPARDTPPKVGSKVEVTGICVMETNNWRPQEPFPHIVDTIIVPQHAGDIVILAHAPWWTTGRLVAIIASLFAAIFAVLIWNIALRRVAARKGHELMREQLGHIKAKLKTDERTRLAVELHDSLAQNLTGVSMEMEAARDLYGHDPKEMARHLDIAAKALKSCRDELRNCLWDLRSKALEEPTLDRAVLITLQPHINSSRLKIRFAVPRTCLSDDAAHALLSAIRELALNAVRHGEATDIRVAGVRDGKLLLCSVADNGRGFDPDNAPGVTAGHFGLQGVNERISALGGSFKIESSPGNGAHATIRLKL